MSQDHRRESEEFVQHLTNAQIKLFRYIAALIGDPDEAGNVLQETNMVIWRKSEEFSPNSNFDAWARSIALWQVKAWLRDRGRDRHVFSPELINQLSQNSIPAEELEPRRKALRECVGKLTMADKELLHHRYVADCSIDSIAERISKTPSAVKSGLFRIRRALRSCIDSRVATSQHA